MPATSISELGRILLDTADDGEASLAAGQLRNLLRNNHHQYHPEFPSTPESYLRDAGFSKTEIAKILQRVGLADTTT